MEKASVKFEKEDKTYIFRVVVEPDEDRWHAYCPALEVYAAATWGYTRAEALSHIQELVEMIAEELAEDDSK
jgi:predicted RNase H-like HicB family nuclease